MGELVDLDKYRAEKANAEKEDVEKSPRELRIDEIVSMLEDFFERNPVDIKPYYVSTTGFDFYRDSSDNKKDDDEPEK